MMMISTWYQSLTSVLTQAGGIGYSLRCTKSLRISALMMTMMTFDVPQFEVTFDIDVNGIMPNVSAQDKSTGEAPNQITTAYAEGSLS